jgi:GTP-binding protein
MIEGYLFRREQLRGLILVMDIRREWEQEEEMIKGWAEEHGFSLAVVLTKADKMSRSAALNRVQTLKKQSGLSSLFAVSVLKKEGHEALESYIFSNWIVS